METIVLYKSQTGFTKKYADWIAGELNCNSYDIKKFDLEKLAEYDTVIYGGGLFASNIKGFKKFSNYKGFYKKNIIVFATGTSPEEEKTLIELKDKNFSKQQNEKIKFFYFLGGMDIKKLKFFSRMMVKMLIGILKRKKQSTDEGKKMLESFGKAVDYTDKAKITPLIEYVNSLN